MNLLTNGNFSDGWTDVTIQGRAKQQRPLGWDVDCVPIGEALWSAGEFAGVDHDPVFETARTIPEIVHKLTAQLPPEQQPGGSDALILSGTAVLKIFSNYNPFGTPLRQLVTGLTPGRTVKLWAHLRAHYNPKPGGDGSPGACAALVWCGLETSDWLTFQHGVQDRRWRQVTLRYVVPSDGVVEVGAALESRSQAGIDWFIDDWRLEYVGDPVPPPPPPDECRGLPRVQYARVYNVIPQDATEERAVQIFLEGWRRSKETAGGSTDDAGLGDLSDKTARLYDIPAAVRDLFRAWYADHYPGTKVVFAGGGAVVPPVVPPPPGGEPSYTLRSDNLIGLHSGFVRARTWDYVEQSGTTIQKFFSCGDAAQAGFKAPSIVSIWRKYVGNEEARRYERPTLRESARWYLDQYTAEIQTVARNWGMSEAQVLVGITAIESLNETIPSHNAPHINDSVEFDVWFAEETRARYGDLVQTVLLNVAIGNPWEGEVPLLFPAAEAVHRLGGFLGYHPYWTANEQRSFLAEHWDYHAGRWMRWDDQFRAAGYFPRYALGEAGIVYAHDGVSFNSGLGWKACGGIEPYLRDIAEYNQRCLAWNAAHGNRCAGSTLFGYGNWQWDSFELGDGEVNLLIQWSQTL